MTADKAPRSWTISKPDQETVVGISFLVMSLPIGETTLVREQDYDALAAERDELKATDWYRKALGAESIKEENKRIYSMLEKLEAQLSREKKKVEKIFNALNNHTLPATKCLEEIREALDKESEGAKC